VAGAKGAAEEDNRLNSHSKTFQRPKQQSICDFDPRGGEGRLKTEIKTKQEGAHQ
jgi:hypothetical protein